MINTWINNALKKLASFFTRVSLKQEQVSKTAVLLNASRLNVSKRSLYTSQVTSSTGIDLKHEATGITTQILGPFTIVTFKKQVRAALSLHQWTYLTFHVRSPHINFYINWLLNYLLGCI